MAGKILAELSKKEQYSVFSHCSNRGAITFKQGSLLKGFKQSPSLDFAEMLFFFSLGQKGTIGSSSSEPVGAARSDGKTLNPGNSSQLPHSTTPA